MRHMLAGENVGLLWIRPMSPKYEFSVLCSSWIVDQCVVGNKSAGAGISYLGPLYLYSSAKSPDLFHTAKQPNLAEGLLPSLTASYGFTPAPEEVLAYIYAVFYSPSYRSRYTAELRIDFPRVPFTADPDLFRRMAALGQQLIDLHLLRSPELEQPIARFEGKGEDRTITTPKYDPKTKRVWINATYYFEGITPEVWQYQIGGYQVLDKYLKARKGRSLEDPRHILRVATALAKTMEVQKEIDALYPRVEENLITF